MVEKFVKNLVHKMEQEDLIDKGSQEDYVYAYTCMLEKALTIGSILTLSIFRKDFFPTVLFLVFFFALRRRTGGYHANTFKRCYIGTIIIYLIVSEICQRQYNNSIFVLIITVFSLCIIELIGTINHPNMHMNREELMESKKAARSIGTIEGLIILILFINNSSYIYIFYLSNSVILCAVLMCIAKFIKQEVTSNEED